MSDEKQGANRKAIQVDEPERGNKPERSSDTSSNSTRRDNQTSSDTSLKPRSAREDSHDAAHKSKPHETKKPSSNNPKVRDRDGDPEQNKIDKQRMASRTGHHETPQEQSKQRILRPEHYEMPQKKDSKELYSSEGNQNLSRRNTCTAMTAPKKLIKLQPNACQRPTQSSQISGDSEASLDFSDQCDVFNKFSEMADLVERQGEEAAENITSGKPGSKNTSVTIHPESSRQTAPNGPQQEMKVNPNDRPHGAESIDRGRNTPTESKLSHRGTSTASSYAQMTTGNKPSNPPPPTNHAQNSLAEASSDGAEDIANQGKDDLAPKSSEGDIVTRIERSAPTSTTHETPSAVGGFVSSILGFRPNPVTREAQLSKELHIAKKQIRFLEGETGRAQETWKRLSYELQRVSGDCRTQARNLNTLGHENQRLKEMIEGMQLELRAVTKKYEDAKLLSDTRGKELHGAQMFLTKADSLSVSDVIQKVNALNEEIFQAAASLGDFITRSQWDISEAELQTRQKSSRDVLGTPLVQILITEAQKQDEPANPLLVQITLQALLTGFCASMIRTWSHSDPTDLYLQKLYDQIRTSSDQAVSGRWRALTRAQLGHDTEHWVNYFLAKLGLVLSTSAWKAGLQDRQSFEARLPTIFKAVVDVRTALGEKFTSSDIEVATVAPGIRFQKFVMEEVYGEDGQDRGSDNVIATTGLGLEKFVPPSPQDVAAHYETVLAPKVVLESSLRAALDPSPRPLRTRVIKRKLVEKQ